MANSESIISHLKYADSTDTWQIQTNEEHSHGVARLCASFAKAFGMESYGYAMGMLHDKGKEKADFQRYIRSVSGYDTSVAPWEHKEHAYVGALLARKLYGPAAELIIPALAGHHTGLYDYSKLKHVMESPFPQGVAIPSEKTALDLSALKAFGGDNRTRKNLHHLYRMLFSCLVDADFLDTEAFMNPVDASLRSSHSSIQEMATMLFTFTQTLNQAPKTPVNILRQQIQQRCYEAAEQPSGFYSLTVPTGGGKTISSLVWAIHHAVLHGMQHIVIAIPYTSIVAQTAATLKSIFGEENVLEHHSETDYEKVCNPILHHRMKLATENWNYPIVVTTNVQLFESMFSNRPSSCRKLHNLCRSVLILDEVQTLPTDFLHPIIDALQYYQSHFSLSVLFTTASQPILDGTIEGCNPRATFPALDHINEIIPTEWRLHDLLRRVNLQINPAGQTYNEIAQQLSQHRRVLCIVNTRRDARELYERLPKEGITIHLSRMMCSTHIKAHLSRLKEALAVETDTVIRVVATQLIEAGVDIDFPVVYRQESGLDSVLQAAGRCNREGRMERGITHVFSLAAERPLPVGSIADANNARKSLPNESDWFAPETMTAYFRQYYCRQDTFDKKHIMDLLSPIELNFETAAKEFQLIDDNNSTSVIVNYENSLSLVEQLRNEGPSYRLLKQLRMYSVNVRFRDFETLRKAGLVEEVQEGIYVIPDSRQYDSNIGLHTDSHWQEELLLV